MGFANRNSLLKVPGILEYPGVFDLKFVADHIAWVCSGYVKDLRFHVVHQLDSLDHGGRNFSRVLVLHFVVFSLRRNAPPMQGSDPLGGNVEVNEDSSVLTPIWPQDFVSSPNLGFDLVRGNHANVYFLVKHHGVGFLVVSGQRGRSDSMSPRGRITAKAGHTAAKRQAIAKVETRIDRMLIAGGACTRLQNDLLFISRPHDLKDFAQGCIVCCGNTSTSTSNSRLRRMFRCRSSSQGCRRSPWHPVFAVEE